MFIQGRHTGGEPIEKRTITQLSLNKLDFVDLKRFTWNLEVGDIL
jgi:hypothetical protein